MLLLKVIGMDILRASMKDVPYRMLAVDVDGTLLCPRHTVRQRTQQALRRAHAAGIFVCVATGRNPLESREVLAAASLDGVGVFVSGALVANTLTGEVLHRRLLPMATAQQACGFMMEHGHSPLILEDAALAGNDYVLCDDPPPPPAVQFWLTFSGSRCRSVADPRTMDHSATLRVGLVSDPETVKAMERKLAVEMGDQVVCQSLRVPSVNAEVMEVFHPQASKWDGVQHVARLMGIEDRHIVAIGDDANDLPMVRGAGLGVAMGNARPPVLEAADMVIGSNEDDGLAQFVEDLLAGKVPAPA